MSFGSNQILPGKPLYRGQGNGGFETADPRSAAKRGQSIPYEVNGAPSGATVADADYGDIVVSGGGTAWAFDSGVVTAFARTILDDANAAAVRTTLGLTYFATGTDAANLTGTVAAARIADGSLSIAKTSGLQAALDAKLTILDDTANWGAGFWRSSVDGLSIGDNSAGGTVTIYQSGTANPGAINFDAQSFAGGASVGGVSANNRLLLSGYGTVTGFEFAQNPYVGTNVIYHAGNFVLSGDVSNAGLAVTIANGAVSLAKMANVASGSLFYRKTAGSGAPEVQTLATLKTDLGLSGTNSGDQFTNMTSSRFLGRVTAGFGAAEELTAAQAKTLLAIAAGDVSGLAAVATSGSASDLSTGTLPAARLPDTGAILKISGMTFGLNAISNTTTLAGAADRHQLIPWTPMEDIAITAIGVECQTAVASANSKVVVYDTSASSRGPNNLLKETGNLDCSTTGYKSEAWSYTFLKGVTYWVGVRTSSTATLRATAAAGMRNLGRSAATGTGNANVIQKTLAFATAASNPYGAVPLGQLQTGQTVYDVIATQA